MFTSVEDIFTTIGHGTLNIADGSGADVNRDINTVEIILRDETTGAIDATLTVDHRLFSESGRTKMVKEMAELPDNLTKTGLNAVVQGVTLGAYASDTAKTLYDGLSPDGKIKADEIIRALTDKFQSTGIAYDLALVHPDILAALNDTIPRLTSEQEQRLVEVFNANGKDISSIYFTSEDNGGIQTALGQINRQGYTDDGTLVLNVIGHDGQTLTGKELSSLLHYELTEHLAGNLTADDYASYIGDFGSDRTGLYNLLTGQSFGTDTISKTAYDYIYNAGVNGSDLNVANRLTGLTNPTQTANNPAIALLLFGSSLYASYDGGKRLGENAAILENGSNGLYKDPNGQDASLNQILLDAAVAGTEIAPSIGILKYIKNASNLKEITNEVIKNKRTGSALKKDVDHSLNDIIDNYAGKADKFSIQGGDGVKRSLYQIKVEVNGKKGIVEWIVDPDPTKGVTHRRFIEGVEITGKPNARYSK